MDSDDALFMHNITVSDVLLFCIVASGYLRARRRRYPLSSHNGRHENLIDNMTSYYRENRYPRIKDDVAKGILIEDRYFTYDYIERPLYLIDYVKEYLEND